MSSILYYITGHGYGHAVRSGQVVRSLLKARPDLYIHVRTTAPDWLFPKRARYEPRSMDVGMVQRDSLDMDIHATVQACRRISQDAPRIVERELAFVGAHDVRLIVGDIPPLCFEIAARASIPSVAVGNFSWNFIYRSYAEKYPGFCPLIDEMEYYYAKTALALTLPYPCDMDVFPRREAIPWIARSSGLQKNAARKLFSLPQSLPLVLLSFGGFGLRHMPWEELRRLRDYVFVTTADERMIDDNIMALPNAQRHYEDLVRAADIVVSKPGYGVVADVIAHRTPMLYTDRGEFPESLRLLQALDECAVAEFIPQRELLGGNLAPHLIRLREKQQDWPAVDLNGAQVAAEKILALL